MSKRATIEGFRDSLAILVAIDNYVGGVPVLQTPVADAESLAEVLQRYHGFDTQILRNEDATFDKLNALLAGLLTRVGKDDRVVFYFAGHGIALESDDGPQGYILPQDADQSSDKNYFPMVDLNQALSALPCRHMLVILDCCFAGALRWASTRDLVFARTNLHRERYQWFIRDAAWEAIASAAQDQKAMDIAAGRPLGARDQATAHSPFAAALIDGLTGLADLSYAGQSGDGVITATELFVYLRDRLMPPPGSGRPRQTPILWPLTKHDKGEFVFLVPGHDLNLPPAPPLDSDANPWLGLKTYDSTQSDLFFGRRGVSESLVARVLRDPLVVVTGPSGIGKSSLVRAGLVGNLKSLPIIPIILRPGPAPLAALAAALRGVGRADAVVPGEEVLNEDPMALAAWIAAQGDERQLLLVIDQAEELITQNRDPKVGTAFLTLIVNALNQAERQHAKRSFTEAEAKAAIEAMGNLSVFGLTQDGTGVWRATTTKDDKPVEVALDVEKRALRVVFTVRSEFEPQFVESPLKDRWTAARCLVPRMTQDELRRVIEGPASVKVIRFESAALVEQLVNEVVEMPGALPVLSFALSQMYKNYIERRGDDRALTFQDYEALKGGVTGSLRVRANEVVDAVDEQHRETARRVLERFVSIEAGAFARRRVPKRELDAADQAEKTRIDEIVRRLDEALLIVTDDVDGEPYLELAHDALILGWDRLLGWVREDATRIANLRLLTPNAEEWALSPKKKSGLLWSDAARRGSLKELETAQAPGLNRIERDFAKASFQAARRNQIIWWATAAALVALTVGAGWFGSQAVEQRFAALQQTVRGRAILARGLFDSGRSDEAVKELREAVALTKGYSLQQHFPEALSALRTINAEFSVIGRLKQTGSSYFADLAFDNTGRRLVTASEETAQLWDIPAGSAPRWRAALEGHRDQVRKALFTSDAKLVVTASRDGRIGIWDAETGKNQAMLEGNGGSIEMLATSTDGANIAAGTEHGTVLLWDFKTRNLKPLAGHRRAITAIAFTRDGNLLASASDDGTVRVWDIQKRASLLVLNHAASVTAVSFTRDGRTILTASIDGVVRIWSSSDGKEVGRIENPSAFSLALDPTDSYFATAPIPTLPVVDAPAQVWDLRTRSNKATLRNERGIYLLAFNPDWYGKQIASASDQDIRIWNTSNGSLLKSFSIPAQDGGTGSVGFSPDGATLASTHANGVVRLWNARPPGAGVIDMRMPVEPRFLGQTSIATVSEGGTVELYEFPSLKLLSELRGDWNFVRSIAIPEKDRIVVAATAAGAKVAEIWSGPTGRHVGSCQSDSMIQVTAVSPTGDTIAIGGGDDKVRVCDAKTGALRRVLRGNELFSGTISFDRSASMIASGWTDKAIRIWSLSDDKPPQVLTGHEGGIVSIAFGPDSSLLVSGSRDRTARVWDLTTGKSRFNLDHVASVSAVAIDPSGKLIATGGADRIIHLWDADNGVLLGEFHGPETSVSSILFSPDGDYILAAGSAAMKSGDNLRLWRIVTEADLIKWIERLP